MLRIAPGSRAGRRTCPTPATATRSTCSTRSSRRRWRAAASAARSSARRSGSPDAKGWSWSSPARSPRSGWRSTPTPDRAAGVGPAREDDGVTALDRFSPATRAWFEGAFAAPTAAQEGAWDAISSGRDTLVVAPTGSGKTLSAFLWSLDRLASSPPPEDPRHRCRVLYVSPLKALAVDVERNLRAPLTGIRQAATRLELPVPDIRVGIRSRDTPAAER